MICLKLNLTLSVGRILIVLNVKRGDDLPACGKGLPLGLYLLGKSSSRFYVSVVLQKLEDLQQDRGRKSLELESREIGKDKASTYQ